MGDLDYVGKRILRKDGPEKVTGKAVYSVDIQLRGKLVGRNPQKPPRPRADSQYRHITGVAGAGGERDHNGQRHPGHQTRFVETPRYPADQYPLAMDKVRFVGEEVAAVAATDLYAADEALELIQVDL
jgi:CO/xanthine dehydrogenase Mo-binding subunit